MSATLSPLAFKVGAITVQRVMEMEIPFLTPAEMFREVDSTAAIAARRAQLEPWALDPATGKLILAVQSYLLRTRRHTVLIDTCVGCDKTYTSLPFWHQRTDRGWLDRLAAAGVSREAVDYVLCTHLHGDHCGWNTMLENGRWVPTFPNAKYVMAREEVAFIEATRPWTYSESVSPVIEAGRAELVDQDFALDDEIWLERLPGHSPAHAAVNLRSEGVEAVMIGDAMHSPLQCAYPDWAFFSDHDPVKAVETRRRMLEANCDSDRLVMTAHFPSPSCGHVVREGEAYGFRFRSGV